MRITSARKGNAYEVLVDGEVQKTKNDKANPTMLLIANKAEGILPQVRALSFKCATRMVRCPSRSASRGRLNKLAY